MDVGKNSAPALTVKIERLLSGDVSVGMSGRYVGSTSALGVGKNMADQVRPTTVSK